MHRLSVVCNDEMAQVERQVRTMYKYAFELKHIHSYLNDVAIEMG